MNDRKYLALSILEGALILFPPLARVVRKAFAGETLDEDDRPLVDEVMARLPFDSESAKAARDMEA